MPTSTSTPLPGAPSGSVTPLPRKSACTYPGWQVDPETELTVICGATEGVVASCLALLDPGNEVVVFEPWYENYWPDTVISGAVPRFVTLHEPDWHIDEAEPRAAFGPRTRAIIVNTPNNPTGKVFRREELELIGWSTNLSEVAIHQFSERIVLE